MHTGGVEFFRFADLQSLDEARYFECMDSLRPLFENPDFKNSTPGFYINYISNQPDDGLISLRLTYYTIDPAKTQENITKFVSNNKNGLALFDSKWTGRPEANQILSMPEKEEMDFRNFLNRNTQIALEVLKSFGVKQFRDLVLNYRHRQLLQGVPPAVIFKQVFEQHSGYYSQLKKDFLASEYWTGLIRLFHGQNPGLHFLVNMLALPEAQYYSASPEAIL